MQLAVKEARGAPSCDSWVSGQLLEFLVDLHLGLLAGDSHSLSSWAALEVDEVDFCPAVAGKKATAGQRRKPAHPRKVAPEPCAASLSRRCRRDRRAQEKLRQEHVRQRWSKVHGESFYS
eukprot:TRINITY_DN19094_c0_g2_i2.p1 TRINITY_DN19094_c0_g2~~TRINITY_DN19094_c0_g2_i2.p1  ORF type:complete len:120 (-),score=12.28 TRINITY_DN19094_c0_g2_i2:210-569(-)